MSLTRLSPTPSTRSFVLLTALACVGALSAAGEPKTVYFADGYHGGVYGHYPPGYTGFLVEDLTPTIDQAEHRTLRLQIPRFSIRTLHCSGIKPPPSR